MPNILESGENAAKAEANKAALDRVPARQWRIEGDETGQIEGSLSATKGPVTFTAYVKALIKGPQKHATAGFRIEGKL